MTIEDNKRLVRRFIEEVVNTGKVDHIAQLVSSDCVETYADLCLTVERQIAEGEWVVTQVTARGTHRGTWLGIKPTGRPVVITGVKLDRVVGGRIVEHGGAANMLEALLEIGAVRVVAE